MKYYFFSLIVLFTACASLQPAGPSATPMKKANLILIETSENPINAYDEMVSILRDEGFSLLSQGRNQAEFRTGYKKVSQANLKFEAKMFETDSTTVIKLKGVVKVPEFQYRKEYGGAKPSTINRIKNKGSSYNPAWKVMNRIALRYTNGKIWYLREF